MGENTFGKKGKLCYLTSAWIWGKEEKEFIFVNPLAFLLLSVDMTYNEKKYNNEILKHLTALGPHHISTVIIYGSVFLGCRNGSKENAHQSSQLLH